MGKSTIYLWPWLQQQTVGLREGNPCVCGNASSNPYLWGLCELTGGY